MVLVISSIHIDDSLHVFEDGSCIQGRLAKEKIVHVMQHELQLLIFDSALHVLEDLLESGEVLVHGRIRIEFSIEEANGDLELSLAGAFGVAEDAVEPFFRVE